ncbi:regulatory protein RecX [Methylotuvimicrobium sp.]|jgi:regulatory protein|uniref:regulatory protein RecX n=1 Tax=Methylotuvimicrobium sp. TaxID=2822413 RepID=UPI003D66111A
MDADLKSIKDVCLRLLARREHSRLELKNKLLSRGFDKDRIDRVLYNLVEQDWLSDSRFAECYARQRIEKGFGPNRIDYELRQLGIENFDLQETVTETAGSWLNVLLEVYRKKYRQEDAITLSEWSKRSRFLLQRGFSGGMIAVLPEHLNIKINPALTFRDGKALKNK